MANQSQRIKSWYIDNQEKGGQLLVISFEKVWNFVVEKIRGCDQIMHGNGWKNRKSQTVCISFLMRTCHTLSLFGENFVRTITTSMV